MNTSALFDYVYKNTQKEDYRSAHDAGTARFVKNISGTGTSTHKNYDPDPTRLGLDKKFDWKGTSWEDYWRFITKKPLPACQNKNCTNETDNPEIVGAHVYKCASIRGQEDKNRWYIVPLCKSCNSDENTNVMELKNTAILAEVDKK